ncbi:hypothetical protein C8J57DRAFT_1221451 [Mycena rebaudengoi]|nr:hypothetical protein C8J57DRAFT_1250574 [Mycena rebaudengoi]KAJ7279812.1 hypothetical protein C8J57DRAFT_1221451 [Mycena rebaudengoi]
MVEHSLLVQRANKLNGPHPRDFYVTVREGSREFRSHDVRSMASSPTWNFESKLSANSTSNKIRIRIFCKKYDGKGELLGECGITTSELLQKCASKKVVALKLKLKNSPSGQVFVLLSTDNAFRSTTSSRDGEDGRAVIHSM